MNAQEYFKEHGINSESIKKFELKWDEQRITIPIKDSQGAFAYNKYRHLIVNGVKFSFDKGSHTSLFNIDSISNSDYVFITEGEIDCIRLDQEGIVAVSNTSGAVTWKKEWNEYFKDKRVYVVYDSDEAGQEGAARVLQHLPQAVNIVLPPETKDICEFFDQYSKEAFQELVEAQSKKETITYEQLCAVIDKWLLIPDKNVIDLLLATIITHSFSSDPLWMFFVAPSSGSKTELVSTVAELDKVFYLSDLTSQTLISGMPGQKDNDPSLLTKLKDNILIMKDFTTVLSMRSDDKQVILALLREIYDGRYSKAFGTGKVIDWTGRITLLAGVTSIVDTHYSLFSTMGERFVMYRIPQSRDIDVAKKALRSVGQEKQMRSELKTAVKSYYESLTIIPIEQIIFPEEILDALSILSSFVVLARSPIVRDQVKREVAYLPSPEAPARLAKQLLTLLKGLAQARGRATINWTDYYKVLKVGIDIIPFQRTQHLLALCNIIDPINTSFIADKTRFSTGGAANILEDLSALELVDLKRGGAGKPNLWSLSKKTREYFKGMLPFISDDIWQVFSTKGYHATIVKEMLRDVNVVDIEIPEEFEFTPDAEPS